MKKVLSLFLSCIFVLGICFSTPVVASATEGEPLVSKEGFEYVIVNGETTPKTCQIAGYSGVEATSINIPQYIKTVDADTQIAVVSVSGSAFEDCTNLEYVFLPGTANSLWVGEVKLAEGVAVHTSACGFKGYVEVEDEDIATIYETCIGCEKYRGRITLVATENATYGDEVSAITVEKTGKMECVENNAEGYALSYTEGGPGYGEKAPTAAGSYTATLTYQGKTITKPFTIAPKTITATLDIDENGFTYNGEGHTPTVKFTDTAETPDEVNLKVEGENADYTVTYNDNVNVGTATATVTLKDEGNYSFGVENEKQVYEKVLNYTVNKKELTINITTDELYTTDALTKLEYTSTGLVENDVIESITFKTSNEITGAGEYVVEIDSIVIKNNVTDVTANYNVTCNENITVKECKHSPAEGKEATCQNQAVCATCGEKYGAMANHNWKFVASEATITATCQTDGCKFNETPATIKLEENTEISFIYTGKKIENPVKIVYSECAEEAFGDILEDVSVVYTYDGESCTVKNAGNYTASVTVGGKTATLGFTIEKAPVTITAPEANTSLTYNGENQELVKAGSTTSFGKIEYSLDNEKWSEDIPAVENAGTYQVYYRLAEADNYECEGDTSGSVEVTIEQMEIDVSYPINDDAVIIYNGTPQQVLIIFTIKNNPSRELTLDENKDYNVKYTRDGEKTKDFTSAGTIDALVTLNDNGNFKVFTEDDSLIYTKELSYIIQRKPLSEENVEKIPDQVYTGEEITPIVTVKDGETTLTLGTDYTVKYSNNTDFGTATVIITFIGNYSGMVEKTFEITKDVAEVTTAPQGIPDLAYTGTEQVLVTAGSANGGIIYYTLTPNVESSWSSTIPTGIAAGTYYVYYKVVGDTNHSDSEVASVEVTIQPKSVDNATITLTEESYTYNGSAIKPNVTVKINGETDALADTEYNVTYGENVNVGTGTVTVTLNDNYRYGENNQVTKTFTITPKEITVALVQSSGIYNGNPHTTDIKFTDVVTADIFELNKDFSVKYYRDDITTETQDLTSDGEIKVVVTLLNKNYTFADGKSSVDLMYTIEKHIHDWQYSASSAVITATCKNEVGCDINETIKLEVNAPENLVYDGGKKEVTYTITKGYEEVFGNEIIVSYAGDKVEQGECINKGDYTAVVKSQAGTAILDFSITPRTIIITDIEGLERDYDGTTKVDLSTATEVKYSNGIDDKPLEFDFSKVTADAEKANVGTILVTLDDGKVTVKGDENGNYQCVVLDDNRITVEITPATLIINPDAKSSEQYYDLPALTYKVNGLIGEDELTKTPTLTTNADIKTVGNYTITATGAEASTNYTIVYAPATLTVTEHKNHKVATDGWKVTVPGTCMVVGKEAGTCTLCSGTVTRDSKIDPNNHKLITTVTKKETCTQNGEALVTCANGCSYSLKTALPADGESHNFAKDFTVVESTCVAKGVKYKVCQNPDCKEVIEKTEIAINPDAHKNVETINVKQPTCEEKGYTGDEYCNDCKKTFEPGIEVNALGHTESDWIVDKEATFTEDGVRHTACTVCSKELKKEVITKLTLATPVAKAYNKTGSIKVKWTDVDNALTYNVYRSDFINNGWTKWKKIGTVNQGVGEFSDKNVVAGKQYKYTVKAYNGDYKSSIKTSNKLIFINPVKPALTITTTGIILKWDTVLGSDKYVAYRSQLVDGKWSDWKSVATIKDGKTSITDTTVESGAIYKYSVRACQGKSYSERKSSATISFLAQPTLKISNTETGIKGSWETINGATGYVITRSEYSDADKKFIATAKLGTAGATVKSFTDKTAKEGVKYKYTVTAISDYGSSVASSGKVLRRLAQPVVTIENANGAIKGNWNQVTGATNYAVYRSEFVDGAWTKWKKLGTAGATAKSFTDKTVKSGVNYKYTVKAINGGSKSSVGASNNVVYLTRPEPTAVNSIYGVKINWNAVSGAESYIVYRKTSVNEQWSEWQQIGTSSTNSYIDSTAVNTGKYKYTVHAVNGNSLSARKASAAMRCVTTPTTTAVVSGTAITLSWNEIPGATKYVVYRQVLGADGKWSASTKIASLKGALAFSDTTAPAGSTYRYKVYAYNGKTKSSAVFTDGILIPIA